MALQNGEQLTLTLLSRPDADFAAQAASIDRLSGGTGNERMVLRGMRTSYRQADRWIGAHIGTGQAGNQRSIGYAWVASRYSGILIDRMVQRATDAILKDTPPVQIEAVGTHPEYRNQGIGSALLHAAIGSFENDTVTMARVPAADIDTQSWLQHRSYCVSTGYWPGRLPFSAAALRYEMLSDIGSVKGATAPAMSMIDAYVVQTDSHHG